MNKDEYKAKRQWLSEFYAEAARTGREIQICMFSPAMWFAMDHGPNVACEITKWRLKPEPQKAWVVWYNGGGSIWITTDHEKAVSFANHNCSDAIIQEITRPD